ncbi:MAG: hypothetical protein UU82_C0031G0005 [Candidatus Nomurabacteria bacterium GW2011_GWC2_41_8]|uniref:Uncharacterized protein n=2 Tax=Candidatus Nomuraibacteriota TaxID=1752729 RepID=A0A1F6YAE0_9BACT|nr:MAG: hypothetical protein UU82_C0031G0005 [Candidatus Nomurabacteria bacterium GW2011_GWC2_41_8]OGI66583.1 MAG: hypothetical protein A2823_00505 [Candidatus Nomurabacteria bacterium RIFCSPHIGHO2_01_FULL_41_91]OGI80729.1 MAG: hypothetical protein A3D43_02540 [Candidatus Nomurabacteria bacterium RIFCSPHIGHO2_02_FULL_41_52]OGI84631.1 MAG: hypothetical protein A3F49_02215 [Candidatus Nomurabacteria bacterium RIFCSPHIGHO2_12_FULL_42_19]OGI94010.1 MAG: hypothetical protein A3A07_00785 [Candidatus 
MSLRNIKLFIGAFVLLIYISIGIFGLFKFSHIAEAPMVDCPYAQNGYSICENSFDHINNWRQFSSAIFPSLFLFSFLIFGMILYFLGGQVFSNQKPFLFYKWKLFFYNKTSYNHLDKIIKWLSLFENSPSVYAV